MINANLEDAKEEFTKLNEWCQKRGLSLVVGVADTTGALTFLDGSTQQLSHITAIIQIDVADAIKSKRG